MENTPVPAPSNLEVLLDLGILRVERHALGNGRTRHAVLVYGRGPSGQIECLMVIDEAGRVAPTTALAAAK